MSACAELISRCFAARTAAHIAHLKTTSYAEHKALEFFYEGIVPLVDEYAEAYMGAEGHSVSGFVNTKLDTSGEKIEKHLRELRDWLAENRGPAGYGRSELLNLVDGVIAHCDKSLFMLSLS